MKTKAKEVTLDVLTELTGGFLIAVSLNNFALPAAFPMTGFSGIAMLLYRLFGLPMGLITILLNIPVAAICYRLLGLSFFLRSIRAMVISSLLLDYVAPVLPYYHGDRLLAAICAGVLGGLGYSMIYMRNSSTGGMDFIILSIKAVKPHLSLGKLAFFADLGIIFAGGIVFQDIDGIIYGVMINYIFSISIDKLMYGLNAGKVALVVTNKGPEVAKEIEARCGRGATILPARGAYRQESRDVVLCACSTKQMYTVERAVKAIDPISFTVVLESNEVLGEGFRNIRIAQRPEKQTPVPPDSSPQDGIESSESGGAK